jgi:hydroxymethylpyrimidine pyrophosphatase-like HAD family hydrolase
MDVDGTLTTRQRAESFFKWGPAGLRPDVIAKVNLLIEQGHEIILWTGDTEYAQRVLKASGIKAIAAIGKPDLIVDNLVRRNRRRFSNIVTPEQFLEMQVFQKD